MNTATPALRPLLLAAAAILLSTPVAAQYPNFKAAITKQLSPLSPETGEPAIVELVTVVPQPYQLQFKSLSTPAGVAFKENQTSACAPTDVKCKQRFYMKLDAYSSKKCSLTGSYTANFDVQCPSGADKAICTPGQHQIAFSLQSENFCFETAVDTSKMWQQVKSLFASDVGLGGTDVMWFLDAKKLVPGGLDVISLSLNATAGMRRSGGAVRVDVDPQGNGFVANDKGDIFHYNGKGWTQMQGKAKDVGVGANGTAWVIGTAAVAGGYEIFRWANNGWVKTPGGAVRIDVDPQGNAWVVNDLGDVFRFVNNNWVVVPGVKAVDVGVGANGAVFVAGRDGAAYRWDGQAWSNRGTAGSGKLTDITVTPQGAPVAVNEAREIWIGQP